MPKFRKKPVVIEAWMASELMHAAARDWSALPAAIAEAYEKGGWVFTHDAIHIPTAEGTMRADPGDMVIRGVAGEFYPCKPAIFESTYTYEPEPETPEWADGPAPTTQHYVGTKIVRAWRAYQVTSGEPEPRDGYSVQYEDGYTSWSPKAVFEAAYLPLGVLDNIEPRIQRLHAELAELMDRHGKLEAFLVTQACAQLPNDERARLLLQDRAMRDYAAVLRMRIGATTDTPARPKDPA